jgi:hypothetical protein
LVAVRPREQHRVLILDGEGPEDGVWQINVERRQRKIEHDHIGRK